MRPVRFIDCIHLVDSLEQRAINWILSAGTRVASDWLHPAAFARISAVATIAPLLLVSAAAQDTLSFTSVNVSAPHDWYTPENWRSGTTLSQHPPSATTIASIPGGQSADINRSGAIATDVNINTNDPNAGLGFLSLTGSGANLLLAPNISVSDAVRLSIGKGKVTLLNGGTIGSSTTQSCLVDLGSNGTWNDATLEINGGNSTIYGSVLVGDNGSGTLNVLNGGTLQAAGVSAGLHQGAIANITVTGANSVLTTPGITLGAPGNDVTPVTVAMNVTAGARVSAGAGSIAVASAGRATATLNLDGTGTTMIASAISTSGGTATINVTNGAVATLSSLLNVGVGRGAGNSSTMTVSGAGSTVNVQGQVTIQNPHVDTVSNPVSLTIGSGGLVNVTANAQGIAFVSLGGPLGGETPGPSKISLRAGGVLQMAAAGNMTIYYPATLEGAGTFKGALEVRGDIYGGGTLSPGDDADAGVLTVGSTTLGGAPNSNFTGAVLALKLRNDPSGGTAGTTWSQLAVNGTLTLPGTGYATVRLKKILADATTWNGSQAKTWSGIVATTGGITGFRTGALVVDANDTDFHAAASGYQFSVVLNGKNLDLVYGPPTVAPVIVTQPQPQTIAVGSSVTFSVVATGSPTPTYQWQKDGTPINGATNANYRIATTQSGDAGTYTVVVSNGIGTITSNGAALAFSATAPAIATQPKGQTVNVGASATFSVEATGTPAPTYQWRKDGTPISGATNASYTINSVQAGDAGSYTVALTNSSGVVTSSAAVLTVTSPNSPPLITTQPQSQSVAVGGSANFSVVASSTPAPTYQWQKNGAAISGATAATYTTPAAQPGDSGSSYAVVVTNSVGSVTSASATLTVSTPATAPIITTQPTTQSVPPGGSVSFSAVASGSGPFTYQWRKNGTAITGATNSSFAINAAQASDAGSYSVVVANSAGSTTSATATLTVVTPAKPVVTAVPQSQTVSANQTVTLAVSAAGAGTLSYQWNKNGAPIAGATGATLVLSNVQKTDAGSYTVTITNPNGSTTSDAALISVSAGPAITAQPQSQNVNAGSTVSLSVLSSAPGVSYQWKKNGVAIAGATNASYTLAAVASGDMGFYACTLTNANGATESAAATLTVAGGAAARPVNISTRALVTSAEPLTAGFVLSAPKTVVIRATGPALQQFGVTGVLADPKLEVIPAGASTPLASNDDWGAAPNVAALTAATAASGAFPLPSGSKDSALLLNLPAGGYTARVTGADGGSGIALIEVYDADGANSNSQLINISARATVGTGGNSLVPGFVVSGVAPRLVLIRAIGPGLASFGVANTLADPQLTVIPAGASYSIAGNDNWGGTTALKTAFAAAGAFALDDSSKDAAVLLRLPPGGYTVVVSGTATASGTAIVEVYDLGP